MLSAASQESAAPSAPESVPSAVSLRRITVTFASERGQATGPRRGRRDVSAAVSLPRFSRIVFRAGSASVR
jgi:hypothetical protein